MNNKGKTWMGITPNESWGEWEERFSPCWNDEDKEWVSKQISEAEDRGFREGVEYCNTINEQSHISNCECLPFNHSEDNLDMMSKKKAMINEVIKESSADQRLVMYKADLIRELEGMYFIEAQGIDELMAAHNGAIYEVIQIIKKQE